MVSSAGIPPLIGTAARRRGALAHLSPIFDLHRCDVEPPRVLPARRRMVEMVGVQG
jgi:hypothetical protein